MKATVLTIGDEILIGQTIDTNSATIAKCLNGLGIGIRAILSVSDTEDAIIEGLKLMSTESDVILITGGLGPTKDDITKHALAFYFEDQLIFQEDYFERVKKIFAKRNIKVTEAHRLQFFLPSKAKLFVNELGSAPGMYFEKEGKIYFSMPGVPYEMEHLLKDRLVPLLLQKSGRKNIFHRTLMTAGCGETSLAEQVDDILKDMPESISMAYLPNLAQVKLRLTTTGDDQQITTLNLYFERIKDRLKEHTYGENEECLEAHIGMLLMKNNLTLSTAESCTGGYIGHLITSIPGSSAYFQGGIISYSNELKKQLLGVSQATLETYGAVSEETVLEMQNGAVKTLGTSISVAISGIAGPDGGTPEKPVGTIWIACGNEHQVRTKKILAGKNRIKNIEYAALYALNMIRQFINEVY